MNKTKNGRFIERRIKLKNKLLRKIIQDIKKDKGYTWKELSNILGVGEHSIRVDWFKSNRTIPFSIFKRLIFLNKKISFRKIKNKLEIMEPFWGQKKAGEKNLKKNISLPNINSKEFAEFWGIMMGDGCIYSDLKGFCITGHKTLEKEYYNVYIKKLIKKLFSENPKFSIGKNSNIIRCYVYSKQINLFLTNLGFPKGKKKNLEIPLFFKKKEFVAFCIRGLFDTDGSLSGHPNAKIMIHLSITQQTLKNSVIKHLRKLNIKVSQSKNSVYVYGIKEIDKFFKIIGSSNPKNKYKYNIFKKTGKVPSSNETESFLMKNE